MKSGLQNRNDDVYHATGDGTDFPLARCGKQFPCSDEIRVSGGNITEEKSNMKSTEQKIIEIKKIFLDEWSWSWVEISIRSMFADQESYIAKAVYVDKDEGKYRDIYFYPEDPASASPVQADADGKTIGGAVGNLLRLIKKRVNENCCASPERS